MTDDTTPPIPNGVSATAIGVAAVRAQESLRPDQLFDDPLAARFLEAAGYPQPLADIEQAEQRTPPRARGVWRSITIRTRFLDEFALAAAAAGARQLVLLGAGLDTRAFRLDWPPGLRIFEVDLPEMLDFKRNVLAGAGAKASCDRVVVPADLLADWPTPLIAAGLDTTTATAWIAEGLLVYFSTEQNNRLLDQLGALSVPGSRLAMTTLSQRRLDRLKDRLGTASEDRMARVVRMWQSGVPDDPISWLADYGWSAMTFDPMERAAAYGRPGLFDDTGRESGTRGLITAIRV